MVSLEAGVLGFVGGWIVSTIIIYIVTKLFGEREGVGTAVLTALVGAIIYAVTYLVLGSGLLGALIGGFAWLAALGMLYKMGWMKAVVVAVMIWVAAAIIGFVLPTAPGPL